MLKRVCSRRIMQILSLNKNQKKSFRGTKGIVDL